ncbi:hypothetical protein A2U01_0087706, partial [Trifolium medium]|nr:hypothetical protein [Trifolium medium]
DQVSELVEGISGIQVSEDKDLEYYFSSEPQRSSEPVNNDTSTSEAIPEPEEQSSDSEEESSDSEENIQIKNTFKYKSSHPEEL